METDVTTELFTLDRRTDGRTVYAAATAFAAFSRLCFEALYAQLVVEFAADWCRVNRTALCRLMGRLVSTRPYGFELKQYVLILTLFDCRFSVVCQHTMAHCREQRMHVPGLLNEC